MSIGEDVLNAAIPGAYGSILQTFMHLLCAEASFLKRIHGASPEPGFGWEGGAGLAQMAAYEGELGVVLLETLQRVPPTQFVHEEGEGWTFDYQARLIFMSVAYHGIAHRTDMTTMLSSHGFQTPELDIWAYQAAHPERFQARITRRAA